MRPEKPGLIMTFEDGCGVPVSLPRLIGEGAETPSADEVKETRQLLLQGFP